MIAIIKFIFHIIFIICLIKDIKEKIVPEIYIDIMFILMIIKTIYQSNYILCYISLSIFILPIFLIMIAETYINKEIIGLGDIKLFILIAIYFSNNSIYFVYCFYTTLYIISAFSIVIFIKIKEKYIAFVPYMYLTFLIYDIKRLII